MKQTLKIAVTLLFSLLYADVGAKIIFEKYSHDFGDIAEDGGSVEHIFAFRNTSDNPVVVVAAHTSCGCTKAEFSRKPVMPDSVATIKVVFNPMNYPGSFARKITVVTDGGALQERLLITGQVLPRKKTIEEQYPIIIGDGVRVVANAHSFGYLEHGKAKQSTFDIVNTSGQDISLAIENPYSELEFYSPERVKAGEEVSINFVCMLPENSDKYGSISYSVYPIIDGQKGRYPFIINGMAIDSREENANNCPQMIALSENFIKFGAVKCDDVKLVRRVELRNNGTKPLIIRKLELLSEGFAVDLKGESTIEIGGKRELIVEINPSRLPFGAVVEKLRIVSNDPKTPVYTIRASAIVER